MSSLMHLGQLSLPGEGGKFVNPVTDNEEENNITITRERNTCTPSWLVRGKHTDQHTPVLH